MCLISIFDIYKVTLKHQNATFNDKIATFAWSKKIDVGGPCGLSAGFVGALLSPAGVLSAAALLSCRKTGKGILPYGKYLKTVFQ